MELEEREGTRRFWGSEVDIEIYPCDETEPATVMVLTSGDLRWGGVTSWVLRKSSYSPCVLAKSLNSSVFLFSHL